MRLSNRSINIVMDVKKISQNFFVISGVLFVRIGVHFKCFVIIEAYKSRDISSLLLNNMWVFCTNP
jgi:hypothetical protein